MISLLHKKVRLYFFKKTSCILGILSRIKLFFPPTLEVNMLSNTKIQLRN